MATAILRLARSGDAPAVSEIYAPLVRDTAVSFEVEPPDAARLRQRIDDTLQRWPWLVCEHEDTVVGYAYAAEHRARSAYRWSVDVSVYVDERVRRRRVGRSLYTALLALLHAQGYTNAFAGIALPNPASVRLHEALGFTPIGVYRAVGFKLDAWHDIGWWQRQLDRPSAARPSGLRSADRPRVPVDLPGVPHVTLSNALAAGASLLR